MAADDYAHVFILRIWREPREIANAPPEWRGVIEHFSDGHRQSVSGLEDINAFLLSYLEHMGVDPGSGAGS